MCAWFPQRSEEGVRPPGTGVLKNQTQALCESNKHPAWLVCSPNPSLFVFNLDKSLCKQSSS